MLQLDRPTWIYHHLKVPAIALKLCICFGVEGYISSNQVEQSESPRMVVPQVKVCW